MIPATAYVASLLGSDCITTTYTRRTTDIRRRAETAPICKEQEAAVWNSFFFPLHNSFKYCDINLFSFFALYFFFKVSHITFLPRAMNHCLLHSVRYANHFLLIGVDISKSIEYGQTDTIRSL